MSNEDIKKFSDELESIIHRYLAGELEYNDSMLAELDNMEDQLLDKGGFSLENPIKENSAEQRIINISTAIKCDIEDMMSNSMEDILGNALNGLKDEE